MPTDPKKRVLIVIEGDPRQSGELAEGMRVAASMTSWGVAHATICLVGKASGLMRDDFESCREEELRLIRPILREHAVPVYRLEGEEEGQGGASSIGARELADLAAKADCLMRFVA